jgi:predicted PurR-regulated permease PerM
MRGRLRRRRPNASGAGPQREKAEFVEIDPSELAGIFTVPPWLREVGLMAWLLVGVAAFLVGAIWLLTLTQTIVVPVITAGILAAVLSPLVGYLERHSVRRGVGTALVFLLVVVIGAAVAVIVIGGVAGEAGNINPKLQGGADKIQTALSDLGVDSSSAKDATDEAGSTLSSAFHTLLNGVAKGLSTLASLAVFLSFTLLSLVFLLGDGPRIRNWTERHLGLPEQLAHTITGRVVSSLRGYFVGVTIVAAFNAVVIGLGALVLGVPLAGSIAVVNFVAAYIPYLGAWSAGAFTVLIALGSQGTDAAIAMAVIALLANGVLQQLIQPIAYGAALGIHPLAVLIVTIAGGALFGTIGLVLAAPLTSAAVRISADVARARAQKEAASPGPAPETGPGGIADAPAG